MPGLAAHELVDMHFHVGVLGDKYPQMGGFSPWYQRQLVYKIFLRFVGLRPEQVSDETLRQRTVEVIKTTSIDRVVCLALDPVYDEAGDPQPGLSNVWVSNDYVIELRNDMKSKVLYGASVHPYAKDFKTRTEKAVADKAVLMKWLPSAQQFDLSDKRVREALEFLATARNGKPLPLLLHVGPEYAIPSTDETTASYDFLRWSWVERIWNRLSGKNWRTPNVKGIRDNLRYALDKGAVIIFAHCGLPYYNPKWVPKLEHSDFKEVRRYLQDYPADGSKDGRAYADVSSFATPFRKSYFGDVRKLPATSLLYGSDFPTPTFKLTEQAWKAKIDFKDIIEGRLERILVPPGNLLDVNYQQMAAHFPGHDMFVNFGQIAT